MLTETSHVPSPASSCLKDICLNYWKMLPGGYSSGRMAWWVEARLDSALCLFPTLAPVFSTQTAQVCVIPLGIASACFLKAMSLNLLHNSLWGKHISAGQLKRPKVQSCICRWHDLRYTDQGSNGSPLASDPQTGKHKAVWWSSFHVEAKEIQESLGRICQVWQLLLSRSSCFDVAAPSEWWMWSPLELQRRQVPDRLKPSWGRDHQWA